MTWTDTPPTREDVGRYYWYLVMPEMIDGAPTLNEPDIGRVEYMSGYVWMHGRYPHSWIPVDKRDQRCRMIFAGPIEEPKKEVKTNDKM